MKLTMKITYKVSEHMEEYNKITELPISRPYSVMLSPSLSPSLSKFALPSYRISIWLPWIKETLTTKQPSLLIIYVDLASQN